MRRLLLLTAILCAAAAVPVAAAATHVSGTYASDPTSGVLECTFRGPPASALVVICHQAGFESTYTGSLTGVSVADFTTIINCRTGRTVGQGTETFTGTIAAVGSGTLTWNIRFTSSFDCATFAVSDFAGSGAIVSGTGALAGLQGTLQFGESDYQGDLR